MSEPVKDNTPVQDGQFYLLSLPNGGVLSAVQDQWGPDSVRIRVFENTHRQWWKAEANNGGFGFRNRHTGKLLGTNGNRDIAASANAVDDWERFFLADTSDGKTLSLIFHGRKEYVFYTAETDFLSISDQASRATPLTIKELE